MLFWACTYNDLNGPFVYLYLFYKNKKALPLIDVILPLKNECNFLGFLSQWSQYQSKDMSPTTALALSVMSSR